MVNEGWYPDPRVEPLRWRWWDGTSWSERTRGTRSYPGSLPVTGRWSRAVNYAMFFLALVAVSVGTTAGFRALFPVGDPGTVFITALNHDVAPRSFIGSACANSVRAVKHLVDDSHDSYQEWSVVPIEGHVDRAFLNVDSGAVTCP